MTPSALHALVEKWRARVDTRAKKFPGVSDYYCSIATDLANELEAALRSEEHQGDEEVLKTQLRRWSEFFGSPPCVSLTDAGCLIVGEVLGRAADTLSRRGENARSDNDETSPLVQCLNPTSGQVQPQYIEPDVIVTTYQLQTP